MAMESIKSKEASSWMDIGSTAPRSQATRRKPTTPTRKATRNITTIIRTNLIAQTDTSFYSLIPSKINISVHDLYIFCAYYL